MEIHDSLYFNFWEILLGTLALELLSYISNSIWFGCEPAHLDFVSNLFALGFSLGPFRLEDSLVNFALGTFVRKLSLWSFRPGMLAWIFSLGTPPPLKFFC